MTSRLDVWLTQDRGITRTAAQVLVTAGMVTVNGRPGKAGDRIREGDVVTVAEAPVAKVRTEPVDGPKVELHVVYEDDALAVIDKPAGLVVHPAAGHPNGTLADGLKQRGSTWSLLGGPARAGIVHRLDRDTSGLLVVAKTETAHRSLAAQLASRTLGRTYWALVWGVVAEETGTIEAPIGRDRRDRKKMAVADGGKEAVTDFTVIERLAEATVLDVNLRTGRTHQIRVHLAYISKPLVGDPVYGKRADPFAGRPALHARQLRFTHPVDGRDCVFDAPLPTDLVQLLATMREAKV